MSLGRLLLQSDYNRDLRKQQKWAQEEGAASGLWGNIGGLSGGLLAATLLSGGLAGIPLALAVGAGAGLGSYGFSKIGGATVKDIDTKFGQGSLIDLEEEIKDKQLADAITTAGTAATMSYMSGLGAGGKTPVDEAAIKEAVEGAGNVTIPTPDISGLDELLATDHASQLSSAQAAFDKINPPIAGQSYAGRPSAATFTPVDPATINLDGTTWDTEFLKGYEGATQQDALNLQGGDATTLGPEFLRESGIPSKADYLTQVENAQRAWQESGGPATELGPWEQPSKIGLFGEGGESMFDFDALKAAPGKGWDWMKQHPMMSAGLGGGGLLALLMMMSQGRK